MSVLSENLIKLRKQKNLSQAYLSKICKKSQQSYGKYENAVTEPDTDTLKIIANFYEVTVDYLLGIENFEKSKGIKIPVLGSIPAGIPIEAIEDILDYEEITQDMANSGEFFGLKVKGNSMEPRILSGDVVIVKKQEDANSGDICVVMVNGFDATLKQIKKDTNGIWLVPFNQQYAPTFYTNEQIEKMPVRIIGKVVELRGKF